MLDVAYPNDVVKYEAQTLHTTSTVRRRVILEHNTLRAINELRLNVPGITKYSCTITGMCRELCLLLAKLC
jgi:hypothetical protein